MAPAALPGPQPVCTHHQQVQRSGHLGRGRGGVAGVYHERRRTLWPPPPWQIANPTRAQTLAVRRTGPADPTLGATPLPFTAVNHLVSLRHGGTSVRLGQNVTKPRPAPRAARAEERGPQAS